MGFELRTNTITPKRNTFDHLVERFGDRPATRYQEGTYNLQPMENFHYRPMWDPAHELYDPDYTVLKLTDPYSYSDPRQYYYNTWVSARASHYEGFGKTLKYIEERRMFERLPENWHMMLVNSITPLRHYESGAQLISINACRFAWGTTISAAAGFAAMDRIGNAQLLSMAGLSVGGGAPDKLAEAKTHWLDDGHLQGLRRLVEEALVETDWASGLIALELTDAQLYPLVFRHLDERALFRGAGAYSLLAQHFSSWYTDQQKWITPLLKAWVTDPEHGEENAKSLGAMVDNWYPRSHDAVQRYAKGIAATAGSQSIVGAAERFAAELVQRLTKLGIPVSPVSERVRV